MKLKSLIRRIIKEEQQNEHQYSIGELKKLVDLALSADGAPEWYVKEYPDRIRKAKDAEKKLIEIGFFDDEGVINYSNTHPMKAIFDELGDYVDDNYM